MARSPKAADAVSCLMALVKVVAFAIGIFIGTPLFLVGLTGLLGYGYDDPGGLWPLLLAGGAMMGGAVGMAVLTYRRFAREEKARHAEALADPARRQRPPEPGPPRVLAEWTVEGDEWRAYTARELKRGKEDALIAIGMSLAIGTPAFHVFTGDWLLGFILACAFAALLATIELRSARRLHADDRKAGRGEVTVWTDRVEINGNTFVFADAEWWLAKVRYLADRQPPVLEITTRTETHDRHGPRTEDDVVRVPVPRGREEEARALPEVLRGRLALPGPTEEGSDERRENVDSEG
jgi:predicted outer membrane lipoprotein